MRRHRSLLLAAVLSLALVIAGSGPAAAAPAGWADVTFEGTANNFTGTITQRPAGFPVATVVSDSAAGSVGRQSGASTFLASATPVGAKYGSSRDRPYLNLRPGTAGGGPPSITTYSFERPTPATGWTFVLGDIDADAVTITATGADGQPVTTGDLGFQDVFSYCVPGVCTRPTAVEAVPTWDPTTGVLLGNSTFTDTNGAAAWFEPRAPLRSLTFSFARRSGFPVYQTWFSALSRTVSGTVDVPAGLNPATLTLRLFDPQGEEVATTQPDAEGDYRFADLATYDGYRVQLVRPTGYTSDDPLNSTADLSARDQPDVDFSLRAIIPVPVSGAVTADDDPVPGATITLRDADGAELETTTSDAAGNYLFENVPAGDDYSLTVTPAAGYTVDGADELTFSVPRDSETPVADRNFALIPPTPAGRGAASGTVRDAQDGPDPPAPGVLITVTGPDDTEYQVRTDTDGSWRLDDLPPGAYTVTVTAPDGGGIVGAESRTFTIPATGGNRPGLNFRVTRPVLPATFTADGTVTGADEDPLDGVEVRLMAPDGSLFGTAVTDDDGDWSIDGLPEGDGWTARVVVPPGYAPADPLTFDVDDQDVGGLDFGLSPITTSPSPTPTPSPTPSRTPSPTSSPTPSPTPSPTSTGSPTDAPAPSYPPTADGSGGGYPPGSGGDGLASTGLSAALTAGVAGAAALLLAGCGLLLAGRLRRRTDH